MDKCIACSNLATIKLITGVLSCGDCWDGETNGEIIGKLPTLHTIKPLEWKEDGNGFIAKVFPKIKADENPRPFLEYEIYQCKDDGSWKLECSDSRFWRDCCNDVDWDLIELGFFESLDGAKDQAEKHYMEQLGKCLEVYNG